MDAVVFFTIVQGFRSRPLDGDLSETPLCGVDAVIPLTGHPKVTDLHHVFLRNQAVSGCQVPFEEGRKEDRRKRGVIRGWYRTDAQTSCSLCKKRGEQAGGKGVRDQAFPAYLWHCMSGSLTCSVTGWAATGSRLWSVPARQSERFNEPAVTTSCLCAPISSPKMPKLLPPHNRFPKTLQRIY